MARLTTLLAVSAKYNILVALVGDTRVLVYNLDRRSIIHAIAPAFEAREGAPLHSFALSTLQPATALFAKRGSAEVCGVPIGSSEGAAFKVHSNTHAQSTHSSCMWLRAFRLSTSNYRYHWHSFCGYIWHTLAHSLIV